MPFARPFRTYRSRLTHRVVGSPPACCSQQAGGGFIHRFRSINIFSRVGCDAGRLRTATPITVRRISPPPFQARGQSVCKTKILLQRLLRKAKHPRSALTHEMGAHIPEPCWRSQPTSARSCGMSKQSYVTLPAVAFQELTTWSSAHLHARNLPSSRGANPRHRRRPPRPFTDLFLCAGGTNLVSRLGLEDIFAPQPNEPAGGCTRSPDTTASSVNVRNDRDFEIGRCSKCCKLNEMSKRDRPVEALTPTGLTGRGCIREVRMKYASVDRTASRSTLSGPSKQHFQSFRRLVGLDLPHVEELERVVFS
jgi:hypothetical protein